MGHRLAATTLVTVLIATLTRALPEGSTPPLTFKAAKVLPEAGILACGSVHVDSGEMPFLTLIGDSGDLKVAFYIELPYRGTFLDCSILGDRLIGAGYVNTPEGVRALASLIDVGNSSTALALSFGEGYTLLRAAAPSGGAFVVAGVVQPPGARDSDLLVALVDESGNMRDARVLGTPAYSDFAERCYSVDGGVLLVGSTWGYNVSYSDALIAELTGSSSSLLAIGGADRDEALAALRDEGSLLVVGSTYTSPGGLSDAFVAFVSNGSMKVYSVGWPSYDGFVDLAKFDEHYYIFGYTMQKGKMCGLIAKNRGGAFSGDGIIVCGDTDVIPLSIGRLNDAIASVFGESGGLLVVKFDRDLRPLQAFFLGGAPSAKVRALRIDISSRIYNVTEVWSLKTYSSLMNRSLTFKEEVLECKLHQLHLSASEVGIETGYFEEREPPLQALLRVIESNLPLLILALPILAVIIAVIVTKRRA